MNVRLVAAVSEELGRHPGVALGVGPIAAAAAAARFIALEKPDAVVLVGTAGAYPGGPGVGEVIVASALGMASTAAALGLGYVPRPPPELHGHPLLSARAGVSAARVLTVIAITTDAALAVRHGEAWAVEHMEAYAVAFACSSANVPFAAVLGIANRVGPGAHAEWLAHRDAVQQAAARVAGRVLAG